MCDYKGKPVHVIQIGFGTFDMFLHDDAAWIDVLLQATSRRAGDKLKAIGVDPVEESAGPLQQVAMKKEQNYVSIMLAAVGEETGTVSLFCLPHTVRLKMRQELEHRMPKDYVSDTSTCRQQLVISREHVEYSLTTACPPLSN